MNLQFPTLAIFWTANSTPGTYVFQHAAVSTSMPVITEGFDQIGLLVTVSGANNAIIRIGWNSEISYASSGTPDCIETPGAVVGGYQRYSLVPKEYGPIAAGASATIWLPVAAYSFTISVYSDGTPSGTDQVGIYGMISRSAQPLSQAQ